MADAEFHSSEPFSSRSIFWHNLARDFPFRLPVRFWFRAAIRRKRDRLRKVWSDPALVTGQDMPESVDCTGARRLWPGANDRKLWHQVRELLPDQADEALETATAASQGRFDILGSGQVDMLDDAGRIRWHDDVSAGGSWPSDALYLDVPICLDKEGTDVKVPWELSRFQHVFQFIWTDPDRFESVFVEQWRQWLEENPVGRGVNWACAMDVALRAISWTAAMACWWDQWDQQIRAEMWASLVNHGRFIRDNLEWRPYGRGNHYFADIVGLAVLSATLTDYKPAEEWGRFAARQLRREILQQFATDGFNKECSTSYHKFMVELATLGMLACGAMDRPLSPACEERIGSAYQAIAVLGGTNCQISLIGDNDSGKAFPMVDRDDRDVGYLLGLGTALFGDSHLPGAQRQPEVSLLMGRNGLDELNKVCSTGNAPQVADSLPSSGLFVLGDKMVIKCGPLDYDPVGAHRHLDQLSFCLSVKGTELIVDPGQLCYTTQPKSRDYYRSTKAHNTVLVDAKNQSRMLSSGRRNVWMLDDAKPRCLKFETEGNQMVFVGTHRGYDRLSGGGEHRREVCFDAVQDSWLVTDTLELSGKHTCQWNFHIHPDAEAAEKDGQWLIRRGDVGLILKWIGPAPSGGHLEKGWFSPQYGRQVEAATLVFENEYTARVKANFELRALASLSQFEQQGVVN